ncbi:porin family protein [Vibrio rarus]|uniref:porin family protein n=1 Tax=Vibrio rarus TaxID=413403 RepID=UPI0021C38FB7|nr:porin family protein [Vibrio rarus]
MRVYSSIALLSLTSVFMPQSLASDWGYRTYSAPVNYNYFSVALGGGKLNTDIDSDRDNVTISDLNLRWLINEHWITNVQYKGRFTHFGDSNDRADYLTLSGARRFAVMEKGDVYAGVKIGGAKIKLRDQSGSTLSTEKEFLLGVFTGVNYGFTDALEGTMLLEYLEYDLIHESSFELSLDYYFSEKFSLGAYARTIWNDDANLDQGGVVAKIRF